jgi:hypothetical protein
MIMVTISAKRAPSEGTAVMPAKEYKEALEHRTPADDRMKVQYIRSEMGAFVIVAGDIAVLAACIFALWLTHAASDVVAAVLTSAFAVIASMTSAYFGIRAASNVAQGLPGTSTQAPGTRNPAENA